MVNFKTLKSFVTAVDARSGSAAAQQLRLAQSALSQHIASLEDGQGAEEGHPVDASQAALDASLESVTGQPKPAVPWAFAGIARPATPA
jgi:hypothetical protein